MNWLPPNGALHGLALDHLLRWNLAILFWLFIASQVLLVAALLRRSTSGSTELPARPRSIAAIVLIDVLPLLAVTGLYLWMVFTSHKLWAASREQPSLICATPGRVAGAAPGAIEVEVTGVQFQWYFRYPGADGVFGVTRPALINAPAGNPLGLDPADPHSADDIVSAVLMLPAGRPVDVTLRSTDVIHGLSIPGMRLKQDAIPGMTGRLEFTPSVPGVYPILCTQVCGLGHSRMQARLVVLPPADYDHWLAERERALAAEARP
jgi:cytochrome c oxidase subunit II